MLSRWRQAARPLSCCAELPDGEQTDAQSALRQAHTALDPVTVELSDAAANQSALSPCTAVLLTEAGGGADCRCRVSLLRSGGSLVAQDLLPEAVALAERVERRVEVDALHGVARAVVPHLRRAVGERIVAVPDVAEMMDLYAVKCHQEQIYSSPP